MKKLINKIAGLGVAVCGCGVLSLASIVLAFFGSEKSIQLMATAPALGISAFIALLLILRGGYAVFTTRYHSALLHLGCACVVSGWLMGQVAPYIGGEDKPVKGSMAMVDGDVMNALWEGAYLTNYVGKVPFTVKLDKFIIDYYESSHVDQSAGRMPPIKEYRSRITITEPGKDPYVKNVRVNHPVYVDGYHIYQMSWGQSQNRQGQPVTYTVLQFIRDPGLWFVYSGFVIIFAGILLFCIRMFKAKAILPSSDREVTQ
ncbi:MAG: cytochrome c biogenesis protein ResB [Kiritimatiellae bacterium]|nr:cytochrome c biogenesis protein ResB [Kiritimatiellia bacterium]